MKILCYPDIQNKLRIQLDFLIDIYSIRNQGRISPLWNRIFQNCQISRCAFTHVWSIRKGGNVEFSTLRFEKIEVVHTRESTLWPAIMGSLLSSLYLFFIAYVRRTHLGTSEKSVAVKFDLQNSINTCVKYTVRSRKYLFL